MSPDDARLEFPIGPAHALLVDHLTNMTTMQRRVCRDALEEYRALQVEHANVLVELARLTQKRFVAQDQGRPARWVLDRLRQMDETTGLRLCEAVDVIGIELGNGRVFIWKFRKGPHGGETVSRAVWRNYVAGQRSVVLLPAEVKPSQLRRRK
jgi:hypothetical protein